MSGIESLLRGLDEVVHGHLRDHDLHLDLRKQRRIDDGTTIAVGRTLLDTAAHDLAHCHSSYTKLVQGFLQCIEFRKLADNSDLVHAGIEFLCKGRLFHYLDCSVSHGL